MSIDENAALANVATLALPPFTIFIFCAADIYKLVRALKVSGTSRRTRLTEWTRGASVGHVGDYVVEDGYEGASRSTLNGIFAWKSWCAAAATSSQYIFSA